MPWVLAAGYHVAFQGGLEGRRGLALLRVAVELANHSEQGEGQVVELQQQFLKVKGPPQAHAHTHIRKMVQMVIFCCRWAGRTRPFLGVARLETAKNSVHARCMRSDMPACRRAPA